MKHALLTIGDIMDEHKNVAFIEQLFYEQIKALSAANDSFDAQHGDAWMQG